MAGIHHTDEPESSTSATRDVQTERVIESLKDLSTSDSGRSQKKGGGAKKKKQITSTSKTREKEIQRPLSQASYRNKKYSLPIKKSDDTTVKTSVNRLSSSDPSGDALLRKSITGDQYRGLRHSSSSSPSQSSETAKFGIIRRKGRRGSDSYPERGYLLPYGLRAQHAAHKCMWSGSESGSATSPAASSGQPNGEYVTEAVASSKASVSSESRKGPEIHFHGCAQRKQAHKSSKKEFKFEAYMPLCEVQQSLKKGELIEGVLRINPRNYEDAYISAPDDQMDIYIGGIHDRNRALNGDVVAVQLKEPKDWKILWDDLRDYQEKHGCEIFSCSDDENNQKKFSNILPFPEIIQDNVSSNIKPIGTFEIGMFNPIPDQSEEKNYTKKRKRKNRNRKNRLKKQTKESTGSEQEMKHDGITLDSNKVYRTNSEDTTVIGSDTVPKDNSKVFHYIPSASASDRNCYSSTSCSSSVLNSIQYEQIIAEKKKLNIVSDCSKQKERTGNSITNKHWTNESYLENNQLIIIPDDIPHFESMDSFATETRNDLVTEEDSQSEKLCSIAVAPDELTGDEFSQSVSGDSTCSHHLDQLQEDKTFFSCQQDDMNNNINEIIIGNIENELHSAEFRVLEDETSVHNTVCVEAATNSDSIVDSVSTSYNSNSINFVISHNNDQCDLETESNIVTNKWNNDERDEPSNCEIGHAAIESSSLLKFLSGDTSGNMENFRKPAKKLKQKRAQLSKSNGNKKNLTYITELMNHSWGIKFIQKTAKVVHILEKKHTRMAAGSLKLLQDGNCNWVLFSPTDHKLPRIFIPIRDCPPDFLRRSKDFSSYLFLAKIVEWTEDSKFAKGNLIQKLGEVGEINAETQGILYENGIDTKDFDENVLKDLPQESNWCIPHDEIKNRCDFREECVFTIDPSTARDLDDAVSCKQLEDDKIFEIGVHIADVTYFVKDGTALDSIASERATSVYLVQDVIPMLPHTLCEKLCSLNPGEDRLSFSVVWKITAEGEIIEEWFGRSIIRSCAKLSYEDAQEIIENPQKEWDSNTFCHINGKFIFEDIVKRVINLNSIAVKLRQKRFRDGALRLDQVKLHFCLDKDSGLPSGFTIYEHRDSNRLIEEFMLLANMAVAHKIYRSFPDQALLRCHPSPEKKLMDDVVKICKAMGINLNASTSGMLQASLAALTGDDIYSKARSQILTSLCSKPMKCAQYFSSGTINEPTDCHHYALNVPLYTHFTSPIRRYPDIIVHRLLAASLEKTSTTYTSKALQKLANHCNDKKYTAKRVNELSCELFLVAFIRGCGPIDDKAMVMGVMDHSFDVLILSIGMVKRIYCDKLNLKSKQYQKENGITQLLLYWNHGDKPKQEIKIFTLIDVTLSVEQDDPMKINVILRHPGDI